MPSWLKTLVASGVLLVLTFYPTLALQVYTPAWYELGCGLHTRCERLKKIETPVAIRQLTAYWRHQIELDQPWSDKERRHLAEVRPIYNGLAVAFLLALIAAPWVLRGSYLPRAARNNVLLVFLLLPCLFFFRSLWMDLFHPLVFDNHFWKNTRTDLSWYFMPPRFFQYSAGVLLGATLIVNLLIWLDTRKRSKRLD